MKKIILISCLLSLSLLIRVKTAEAVDTMFFDSTDKYLGACQLTDKSEWQLTEETKVSIFEVWYNWKQGETKLPVKLYKDGELFAEFIAVRASCDPYQQQWCNADYPINKVFPAGKYSTKIDNARQCLKPGGTGAIRLYKNDETTTPTTPSITTAPSPTLIPTNIPTATAQPTIIPAVTSTSCGCNQQIVIASAAVTSAIVSFFVWLILKRL